MSAIAPLFIGLDAGTSVIKAIAFDRDGRQVAVAATPNHLVKVEDGGVEQDVSETWQGAASVLAALSARVPDLDAACAAWVDSQLDAHAAPDDALLPIYAGLFAAYCQANRDAVPLWSMLHEIRRS
jgi:erythritol kinase